MLLPFPPNSAGRTDIYTEPALAGARRGVSRDPGGLADRDCPAGVLARGHTSTQETRISIKKPYIQINRDSQEQARTTIFLCLQCSRTSHPHCDREYASVCLNTLRCTDRPHHHPACEECEDVEAASEAAQSRVKPTWPSISSPAPRSPPARRSTWSPAVSPTRQRAFPSFPSTPDYSGRVNKILIERSNVETGKK